MNQDWLQARTAASSHKIALTIGDESWTYAELSELVNRMAAFLITHRVRSGDFIAALLPNSLEYVCLIHALARIGAVLVPLNTRLTPSEIQWQINHVGCKWLVISQRNDEIRTFACCRRSPDRATQARSETGLSGAKFPEIMNCEQLLMNSEWLQANNSVTVLHSPFTIHNLQAIVFTSGTSGTPKGAMITFANHFWSATASSYRLGVQPDDRWLSILPLYHVGGLAVIFRSCLYGTAVILHDHFDLDAINHSLNHDGATLISLVPTMLHRLLQTRDDWPSALRLILLGGAAASPDLIQQANRLPKQSPASNPSAGSGQVFQTPIVATTYGLTEAASQVATMLPEEAAHKPGSVGKPLMFTAVKIISDQGNELTPGEVGEIVVSGPTVMAGYFKRELAQTHHSPLATLHTGDMGFFDKDGDLWVVQRRSDLIVSGGENVYPAEIEAVLRQHAGVAEVCVVGVPHTEWGEQVAAAVVLKAGFSDLASDSLAKYCRQHLAGYKQPRRMIFLAELPRTASGKIHRQSVIDLLLE